MTNLTFISLTKYEHAHTSLVTTDLTSPISGSTDGKGYTSRSCTAIHSAAGTQDDASPPAISIPWTQEGQLAMTRLERRLTRAGVGRGP